MPNFVRTTIFLSLMSVTLSGCNPFREFAPDSETLVMRGFAKQGTAPPPYPLYCYHTLGEKMCYAQPLKKTPRERVSGYYGPPPPVV